MQASTESACFRKLSDWVNSINRFQASLRVMMPGILPTLDGSIQGADSPPSAQVESRIMFQMNSAFC
jgi:hypothetical protein